MELDSKNVLLTGASGGIGNALALALASQGAQLILAGRNADRLEALRQKLQLALPNAPVPFTVVADLNTEKGRQDIVTRCEQNGIDILINSAGYQSFGLFETQSEASLSETLQTNLLAPMALTHDLLPLLRQRPDADIVNIGSTFGSIGHPAFVAYCASKFGLRGFSQALRRELSDTGIRVHYLAPRGTKTRLNSPAITAMNQALGNIMDEPEVVAQVLLAALRSEKGCDRYIGWPEKLFVRLNCLLPGVVDRALGKQLITIRRHATEGSTTPEKTAS
ncbi:MAG: SDR family oxidoreductase [Porticoccaceae bacterium]|nr:SDR family oxidoreductase [Porticoccaceae bacterium]